MKNGSYLNRIKMVSFNHMDKHNKHSESEDTSNYLSQIKTHFLVLEELRERRRKRREGWIEREDERQSNVI